MGRKKPQGSFKRKGSKTKRVATNKGSSAAKAGAKGGKKSRRGKAK